jgi:hypothetical protein
MTQSLFLPGLPVDLIEAVYRGAPGNEIESGKFASPESSAALVANTFGAFLGRPADLPPLPNLECEGWPASSVDLEAIVRFPWSGGRHPCLDVLVATSDALIGIESKRFEPFRPKGRISLSEAYWRPVWGSQMSRYEGLRDALRDGSLSFTHLDAVQLIKHAFGLRTAVQTHGLHAGKRAILYYIHAEPDQWPDGPRQISPLKHEKHTAEIAAFGAAVEGDEVEFRSCSYRSLLKSWEGSESDFLKSHARAVAGRFAP